MAASMLTKTCGVLSNNSRPLWRILSVGYAKKVGGAKGKGGFGGGGAVTKKELEVETDPEKLTKFLCGGNFYRGGSDPELKPDSEYPDWLWELKLDRTPMPFEELDPESDRYWNHLRKRARWRHNKLAKTKKF